VYPANPARGAPEDIKDQSTTDSFQPRVALTYAISDSTNVYLQVARGNNPAGFNTNTLDPVLQATAASEGYDLEAFRTYDEEKLWNYELGLKGDALEGELQYAVAVYYLDWTGYVQPVTANWTPADGVLLPGTTSNDYFSRLFINGGDLNGVGFEAEGSWRPTPWLTLGGSISYSTLEFTNDSCSPIPLDYGVPAIQTEPYRCASIGGALPPMFSDFTTALYATATHQLSSSLEGYARIDHQYRSKRYTEVINTDYIPALTNVDLRFGVRADKWSAELYATNLLDDDTPSGAVRFFDGRLPGMVFNTTYQPRRPREFGISLAYDF
jgi:iron complex outermembrane receptor protein